MYITQDQAANLFLMHKTPGQCMQRGNFITAENLPHPYPEQIAQELIDQDLIETDDVDEDLFVLTPYAYTCFENGSFHIYNEEDFTPDEEDWEDFDNNSEEEIEDEPTALSKSKNNIPHLLGYAIIGSLISVFFFINKEPDYEIPITISPLMKEQLDSVINAFEKRRDSFNLSDTLPEK
tara:strand:+ start:1788 stop:2324 length:537 start_codon:yes stop_codon:yes gene_type:complete